MAFKNLPWAALKANPYRDPKLNPVELEPDDPLLQSVEDYKGQFRSLPVRPSPTESGTYEIACGHRLLCALQQKFGTEGLVIKCDVQDRSDYDMIMLQLTENATQGGLRPAAVLDAVAALTQWVATELLCAADWEECRKNFSGTAAIFGDSEEKAEDGFDKLKTHLLKGIGIGWRTIVKASKNLLEDGDTREAIAVLKATGEYPKIIERAHEDASLARVEEWQAADAKCAPKIGSLEARLSEAHAKQEEAKRSVALADKTKKAATQKVKRQKARVETAKANKTTTLKDEKTRLATAQQELDAAEKAVVTTRAAYDKQVQHRKSVETTLATAKQPVESRKAQITAETKMLGRFKQDRQKPKTFALEVAHKCERVDHVRAFRKIMITYADLIPVSDQLALVERVFAYFKKIEHQPTSQLIEETIMRDISENVTESQKAERRHRLEKDVHERARDAWKKAHKAHTTFCNALNQVTDAIIDGAEIVGDNDLPIKWEEMNRIRERVVANFLKAMGMRAHYTETVETPFFADVTPVPLRLVKPNGQGDQHDSEEVVVP